LSPNHFKAHLTGPGSIETRITNALNLYSRSEKHESEKVKKREFEMISRGGRVKTQKLKSCSIDSKSAEVNPENGVVFGANFHPVGRSPPQNLIDHNRAAK